MAKKKEIVPGDVVSVTFILASGATRTFSASEHGEEFAAVAAEFEKNNASKVNVENNASQIDHIVTKTVEGGAPVPDTAPASTEATG